jgi:hypothetical protein
MADFVVGEGVGSVLEFIGMGKKNVSIHVHEGTSSTVD